MLTGVAWRRAGCIYSMPITRCPVCDQEFGPDEGLFILPVEPYSAGMLFGDDDRRGREDQHQTRFGRLHHPPLFSCVDVHC